MLIRNLSLIASVFLASGCTTGAYLKPEASEGTYSFENPSCGGNPEVLEFSPLKQNWLVLRVYARQTHEASIKGVKGTVLMISFRMRPWTSLDSSPSLLSNGSDIDKKAANQRTEGEYLVLTSKDSVSVELPAGAVQEINIPMFRSPHQIERSDYTYWPIPVQIAPVDIDQFTITFPKIKVNGEELLVPPIHFKKDAGGQPNMILNC
jgi:hypothetical protein